MTAVAEGEIVGEVLAPGQFTLIAAAPDYARVAAGLPPGGPFDLRAAARANAAAGNRTDAPLLECVMVGPTLRLARRAAFCAGDDVRLFAAGEVAIGRFHGALRGYLAIEGGFDEARGRYDEAPHVLQRGEVLRGGNARGTASAPERDSERLVIRIANGPHDAPPLPVEWEVTNQLNRVGIRLRPVTPIAFTPPADLASCGMQFGTLQWHPDGSLVAMGPDHPVTGGYLQPATVLWDERWKLGQLAPGERVSLVAV
jgi:urea carboxylase